MGYPIKHIVGFDGETYDLVGDGGGGANCWRGTWTDLNNSVYSNIEINNSDPLKLGDIVEVCNDDETIDTLATRYVDLYDINSDAYNKIFINMNGDFIANEDTSISHLSPARRWHFLVVNIDDLSGDITLVPINTPKNNDFEAYLGGSTQYDDTNINEVASKVLSGYGCGTIFFGSAYERVMPMDSNNTYVAPTEQVIVRAPSGRCTYIYHYATATNAITKLDSIGSGDNIQSIPYIALAPYDGGIESSLIYFDPDIHEDIRGWKFSYANTFTLRSYNWFIVDTLN